MTFYCSSECHGRAQHSIIAVSNHGERYVGAVRFSDAGQCGRVTPADADTHAASATHRYHQEILVAYHSLHPGTSSFAPVTHKAKTPLAQLAGANLVLTSQSLVPASAVPLPPRVTGTLKPATVARPRRPRQPPVEFKITNQAATTLAATKYRLDPALMPQLTLTSMFLPSSSDIKKRQRLLHLVPFLRVAAWVALLQVNRAWHEACAGDDGIWKRLAATRWLRHGRLDTLLSAEHQSRKPSNWRLALATVTRRCSRVALENVRILCDPTTWTMAHANRANLEDELVLIVQVQTGAIVGVRTSFNLVQAIAPELSTMDALQRLETHEYELVHCRRLTLFHATRIPLFDDWPLFRHRPFATFEAAQWHADEPRACEVVLRATRRRFRRALLDMLDGLLKRAKSHKRKEAVEAIEAMLQASPQP
ncbi:hypothetical protein ACHHYP_08543 [Achlya hypogyna]|uniref:F-box domain-containing protein n=1 Tax=Achlya hypogyna TaxID=1202772 RepID=A0A1V9YP39_ACHHY|nr:hypothetical protein ACHHYP_08543 [Achlya hypogyna]